MRFSKTIVFFLLAAVFSYAPGAQADTPMCDEIVNDPTIATCTCICEASSSYPGCQGQGQGSTVPTPNQCPDMLQGRRVISRGDALVVADPAAQNPNTLTQVLIYKSENDSTNPGLGVVDGTPASIGQKLVPCVVSGIPFPQQTRFARLFDLPYDMVVTVRPRDLGEYVFPDCTNGGLPGVQNFVVDVWSPNSEAPSVPEIYADLSPQWIQLAIDDFNYDGFDDIFFVNQTSIAIWTAVDTSDPTKGLQSGGSADTTLPSGAFQAPSNEPTTGDFNGDGLLDVAWIGGDFPNEKGALSVFFATICPGDVANSICSGAKAFEVIVDPASKLFPTVSGATSTIVLDNAPHNQSPCTEIASVNESGNPKIYLRAGTVALGNFEDNAKNSLGAPVDELILSYVSGSAGKGSDPCSTDVQYWSFSAPTQDSPVWAKQRGDTIKGLFPESNGDGTGFPPSISLYSQSAYLDWYGTVEQAVIGMVGGSILYYGTYFRPMTVSVAGTGDEAKASVCSGANRGADPLWPYVWGMAVGRFSTSTTVNPENACSDFEDAVPGECPYNPEIAMFLAGDAHSDHHPTTGIAFYTVQPSQPGTNGLECANDKTVEGLLPKYFTAPGTSNFSKMPIPSLRAGSLLRAGDAFGNSVQVGEPIISRISQHTQPQMIIQTPPSLIDYVLPNEEDSSTTAIVNFTRAPGNFNTQIEFATESKETSATNQTTSHSSSFTESVSTEVKFKVPLFTSIDVKNKESWSQFHESNTSSQFSNYVSTALETGGTIGADDQVWWTQTTFNVFHFPVVGETVCPASLTCDVSDPNNIVCDAGGSAANTVELTCSESGDGCQCLSEGASASLCPAIPNDPDTRTCAKQSSDLCCSQLQQQLYMTLSGPEEVTRKSQQGATTEFYHPRHEPGQILSYPSGLILLQARLSNPQELAVLDAFSTGTNNEFETISYSSGCMASEGVGTTTRHTFDTDTSITAGTPKLAEEEGGATITASFDYNSSNSTSTLNSYTVGQTSSSSVQLNLQGAGFLNPDQYAYDVEGIVYGQVKPEAVLDTPDLTVCPIDDPSTDSALCSDADKKAAGCTTTGPLQVAYAADPTAGDGGWWKSAAAYLQEIDIALNNPSRWRSVNADQVANANLQCRGDSNSQTCYSANQPPTKTDASSVWDADFFDMKGLLVTNGGTGGPQRDLATVGDTIYVQVRISNYSVIGTADKSPGSKVYARIYRQQLDVNTLSNDNFAVLGYAVGADGNPLPAVPIGLAGLGDSDPIPVVSPKDGTASIPGFNTTTDPANDNISIATASYTASADDACEYDNGQQVCKGAYYAYWVTVWAEDASGNVLTELPGHGLKTSGRGTDFDPSTTYHFITDVPLETVTFNGNSTTFSNNTSMFKKVFTIVAEENGDALAEARPAELTLELINLTPQKTVLGEPVVVSAQVASLGAASPGATVVFSSLDPESRNEVFDVEWLPYIRADDTHFARASYNPKSCGTHEISLEVAGPPPGIGDALTLPLDVGIDTDSALRFLISEVKGLRLAVHNRLAVHKTLNRRMKRKLIHKLRLAKWAFSAERTGIGAFFLQAFNQQITTLVQAGRIDAQKADLLVGQSDKIIGCVGFN